MAQGDKVQVKLPDDSANTGRSVNNVEDSAGNYTQAVVVTSTDGNTPIAIATSTLQASAITALATIATELNDVATQTTLAAIKAKTDNLDAALSTRTKPSDSQHVVLDAGVNLAGIVSASPETSTVYNGTTPLTPIFVKIAASSSGTTTLVAGVTSKKIRVLGFTLSANAAVNANFQSHTTTATATGIFYMGANGGAAVSQAPSGWFETVAGEALDINLSGSVAVGGQLVYITV